MAHEERFIPPRVKLDQLGVVKNYATQPRLEYRYVTSQQNSAHQVITTDMHIALAKIRSYMQQ